MDKDFIIIDMGEATVEVNGNEYRVTKRYIKADTKGTIWQSDSLDDLTVWEKCEEVVDE